MKWKLEKISEEDLKRMLPVWNFGRFSALKQSLKNEVMAIQKNGCGFLRAPATLGANKKERVATQNAINGVLNPLGFFTRWTTQPFGFLIAKKEQFQNARGIK